MKNNRNTLIKKALSEGVGGGLTGSLSICTQVSSLMWLRTAVSYQYKNGTCAIETFRHLNSNGGVRRFYRGFIPSLTMASLIRFGDVFANTGVLEMLDQFESIPLPIKTIVSTGIATGWRVILMPLDTRKTMFAVYGGSGRGMFMEKQKNLGFRGLYSGGLACVASAFVTHYPWFVTYNLLYKYFPDCKSRFVRNGMIGFVASVVACCTNNAFKVMKLQKQSAVKHVSYRQLHQEIGFKAFTRGLSTRIVLCGIQGFLFATTWKYLEERFRGKTPKY